MPLLVGQIVYTSFPGIGFKSLLSQRISSEIQQAFLEQIVYQHWDTYNPPKPGYRAAYFYQFAPHQSLFGWFYNEGVDDLGRSNIPYCLGYYLAGLLNTIQLENILNCLGSGPMAIVNRHHPPSVLEDLIIPDFCNYQPARLGVTISPKLRKQTHKELLQKKLLNLFIAVDGSDLEATVQLVGDRALAKPREPISPARSQPEKDGQQSLNFHRIEKILQELTAKPIGIQGVALVSSEGQPIIPPIGMDKNSVLIMAGSMLYLSKSTQDELNWQAIEIVSVRAREGHVILAKCNCEVYLLVKAGKALSGLLEGEINRAVEKLQAELQTFQELPVTVESEIVPQLAPEVLPRIDEVLYEFNEISLTTEDEIRYRGRRTNI
jgi:predicted regulator of Ras-like GTPase activity (Roadblock/LC7/MglB family)